MTAYLHGVLAHKHIIIDHATYVDLDWFMSIVSEQGYMAAVVAAGDEAAECRRLDIERWIGNQIERYERQSSALKKILDSQRVINSELACLKHHEDEIKTFADKSEIARKALALLAAEEERIARRVEEMLRVDKRRRVFQRSRDRLFLNVGRRDGFHCRVCGSTVDLSVDHISPLSAGGSDDEGNLQILCRSCNSTKGAR